MDLVKQFELLVQQEIKNHADILNSVFQQLRDLKEEVKALKEEHLQCKAALHAKMCSNATDFKFIEQNQSRLYEMVKGFQSDQNTHNREFDYRINSVEKLITAFEDQQEELTQKIQKVDQRVDTLDQNDHENGKDFYSYVNHLAMKIYSKIDEAKEKILAEPSPLQQDKEEIMQKIDTHRVEASGVLREIRIMDHRVMVSEKKIENIYTLIERLKKD